MQTIFIAAGVVLVISGFVLILAALDPEGRGDKILGAALAVVCSALTVMTGVAGHWILSALGF